jgi:hypothetical protein
MHIKVSESIKHSLIEKKNSEISLQFRSHWAA